MIPKKFPSHKEAYDNMVSNIKGKPWAYKYFGSPINDDEYINGGFDQGDNYFDDEEVMNKYKASVKNQDPDRNIIVQIYAKTKKGKYRKLDSFMMNPMEMYPREKPKLKSVLKQI